MEEHVGGGVVGHIDVEIAICVVVQRGHTQAVVVVGVADARSVGDVYEGAVPFIAIKQVPGAGHTSRPAVDHSSQKDAALGLGGVVGHIVDVEDYVVGDVEVEVAVVVGVEEGGSSALGFEDELFFFSPESMAEGDTGGLGLVGILHLSGCKSEAEENQKSGEGEDWAHRIAIG